MSAQGPALSNRLADLAERAGEAARRYRRGSISSIREYLTAGELLACARGECRRGEWGAVLARAGIAGRTGRLMVQAWRIARAVGADAEAVHEAGGIQAFVARAVDAAGAAVDAAGAALDAVDVAGEKPALNAGFEVGGDAPEPPADTALGPVPDREPEPPAGRRALTLREAAEAPANRRQARRERGECVECGAASPAAYRCAACAARHRASSSKATGFARIGRELAGRIEAAAGQGKSLTLSAGDVARLAEGRTARAHRGRSL